MWNQGTVVLLVLSLALFAACAPIETPVEEPPVTETTATETIAETPVPEPLPELEPEPEVKLPPVNVCTLLSDAQLEELAGTDIDPGTPSKTGEGASVCTWVAPLGGTLVARVYDSQPARTWELVTASLPGFEPVSDLGDRAAANTAYRLFVVQKSPRTLVVDTTQLAGDPAAIGAKFARIAMPKL
ncbi:MAG: hypothetical protein LC732_03070 [Acidobacteria bacterium]|nr:hypothetical protein [Acidobacteriota bacterium]